MARAGFEAFKAAAETTTDSTYRNARNTVAGTLKLLDPALVARRPLEFIAWGVGSTQGLPAETYAEARALLLGWGFEGTEPFAVVDAIDGVLEYHRDVEARRDALPYEMDGVVAKVDRLDLQRQLGRTARTPRWVLAYKFAARQADTVVEDIRSQVGRTGAITPVAELAPVELAGVTVRRASAPQLAVLLADRDVRVGDHVRDPAGRRRHPRSRPRATRTSGRPKSSKPVAAPEAVPQLRLEALELEGAHLYCLNVECRGPAEGPDRPPRQRAERWTSIGSAPSTSTSSWPPRLLKTLEDVFALPGRRKDEILELERWAERSYEKLAGELERAAETPTL